MNFKNFIKFKNSETVDQIYWEFEKISKFGDQTRNEKGCWQLLPCTINFYLAYFDQR